MACCAAPRWARVVAAGRPYDSVAQLYAVADAAVADFSDADLAAALAGHPRIGDRSADARSRREQSGVSAASARTLADIADGNGDYEQRFGHLYLVCATGRTAPELLSLLRSRLQHDVATERRVTLEELAAINRLRLAQLVTEVTTAPVPR